MFSPIDSYEDAGVVFTFGGYSVGAWICVLLAVMLFVGFFVRMAPAHIEHGSSVT